MSSEPELSCKVTPTLTELNIEEEDWTVLNSSKTVSEESVVKVMGVQWDRMEDNFEFDLAKFPRQALEGTLTKRTLWSSTSRSHLKMHVPRKLSFKGELRGKIEGICMFALGFISQFLITSFPYRFIQMKYCT